MDEKRVEPIFKKKRRRHNRILEADLKKAKKLRLPGGSIWWIVAGSFLGCLLFDRFGRLNLFMPLAACCMALGLLLFLKWEQRRYVWFWWFFSLFVVLHALLIYFVHWPSKWVPGASYAGAASLDVFAMLWLISLLQKREEQTEKAILRKALRVRKQIGVEDTPPKQTSLWIDNQGDAGSTQK